MSIYIAHCCEEPLSIKACSRETHSPSRASKTYGHNAFQIIHTHTTVINSGRAYTTQHRTHCGLRLRLQSWLTPQPPHRLRNDLKCDEWDVKTCSIQSNPIQSECFQWLPKTVLSLISELVWKQIPDGWYSDWERPTAELHIKEKWLSLIYEEWRQ